MRAEKEKIKENNIRQVSGDIEQEPRGEFWNHFIPIFMHMT